MNVFDYALQLEQDGKAFYRKLAAESASPGLRKIFTELADDEQKHYNLFKKLQEQQPVDSVVDSAALENAKRIFTELEADQAGIDLLQSNLDAYRYAMKVEKESAELYEEAAAEEADEKIKQLLLKIALEERKHLNILENVFDFVNKPNQSLVWGEFSNLEEF